MEPTLVTGTAYAFDSDRTEEERRLIAQSRLFDPLTEPLLRGAGLGQGMHVIDLGSGAGDTAMLASRLVGPSGSVLGLERSPESVALARRRVAESGITNVAFREADVNDLHKLLSGYSGIDGVIGRLILMWVPDPAAVIRTCASTLPPRSLICFIEPDLEYDFALPCPPLWAAVRSWVTAGVRGVGAENRMGPKLNAAFRGAGLGEPQMESRSVMAGHTEAPAWLWVNIVRGLLPTLDSLGIAPAEEIDVDTLEARMLAELAAIDGVMILPTFTAAWARTPD
jgi:SAM-dependent methyltransferase